MRIAGVLTLFVFVAPMGCSKREAACQDAKAAYDRSGRQQIERVVKVVPAEQAEQMMADATALHEESLRRFAPACAQADEATFACLQQLERFVEAERAMTEALAACGRDDEAASACTKKVQEEFEEAFGQCKETLHAFGRVLVGS